MNMWLLLNIFSYTISSWSPSSDDESYLTKLEPALFDILFCWGYFEYAIAIRESLSEHIIFVGW